jgi:hypothetical protein
MTRFVAGPAIQHLGRSGEAKSILAETELDMVKDIQAAGDAIRRLIPARMNQDRATSKHVIHEAMGRNMTIRTDRVSEVKQADGTRV